MLNRALCQERGLRFLSFSIIIIYVNTIAACVVRPAIPTSRTPVIPYYNQIFRLDWREETTMRTGHQSCRSQRRDSQHIMIYVFRTLSFSLPFPYLFILREHLIFMSAAPRMYFAFSIFIHIHACSFSVDIFCSA